MLMYKFLFLLICKIFFGALTSSVDFARDSKKCLCNLKRHKMSVEQFCNKLTVNTTIPGYPAQITISQICSNLINNYYKSGCETITEESRCGNADSDWEKDWQAGISYSDSCTWKNHTCTLRSKEKVQKVCETVMKKKFFNYYCAN